MVSRIVAMLSAIFLNACVTIPTDALNNYTTAFEKANEASADFLVQFGQTKKDASAFIAKNSPPAEVPHQPYPATLPDPNGTGPEIDKDVDTMRQALLVVATYNAALVALAEGKSVETVGTTAKGLVTALSSFVPIAGSVATAVEAFAKELEKARLRKEFKQALANGAPVVRKILGIIRDNVDTNYENNKLLADNARTMIVADIVERVTSLQSIMRSHAAPPPPPPADKFTKLSTRQTQLNTLIAPIAQEPFVSASFPYPLTFSAGAGGAAYTVETEARLTEHFDHIAAKVKEYVAIVTRLNEYAKSGTAFKGMLDVTLRSLSALEQADTAVPDLSQQASEMLRLAFLVKTHVEAVRAAGSTP